MDSLGLLYEKPSGFCEEGVSLALTFTPNSLFLWKINFSYVCPRKLPFCVSVSRVSLSYLCIHDLKDVFVYWPGSACFQARCLPRTFL